VGQLVIVENQTEALPHRPSNRLLDTGTARAELPKIIIGIKLNDGIEVIRFQAEAAAA
jgi:hypothetical protein